MIVDRMFTGDVASFDWWKDPDLFAREAERRIVLHRHPERHDPDAMRARRLRRERLQ